MHGDLFALGSTVIGIYLLWGLFTRGSNCFGVYLHAGLIALGSTYSGTYLLWGLLTWDLSDLGSAHGDLFTLDSIYTGICLF